MKNANVNIVLILIIIGIGVLAYVSYETGYKASHNNMDALLMTMTIDSSIVTAGLYEELSNKVRKTIHFYIQDTPTVVNDVKLFAEVKYVTIGGEVINVEDGKIWNLIKKDRVFQRRFKEEQDDKKVEKDVPNSSFASIVK